MKGEKVVPRGKVRFVRSDGWRASIFFDFSTTYPLMWGLVAVYNAGRLT
jgi:hypothetical protein